MAEPTPQPYKLEHTPTGEPFILLRTRSPVPIYLTPLSPLDAPANHAAHSMPSLNAALIGTPTPYTLADAESWIALVNSGKADLLMNTLRLGFPTPEEGGKLIGSVGLAPVKQRATEPVEEGMVKIGYWLHPDYRGLGIVKAGVAAVVAWGRAEQGVKTVRVQVVDGNESSRRVVDGLKEFVRCEEADTEVEWPEKKGGGRKKLLAWDWKV